MKRFFAWISLIVLVAIVVAANDIVDALKYYDAPSEEDIQALYIRAENETNPDAAYVLWREMFENREAYAAHLPHVREDDIIMHMISAARSLAHASHSEDALEEAHGHVALLQPERRYWALFGIAKDAISVAPWHAVRLFDRLEAEARSEPSAYQKSAKLHALGQLWMQRSDSGELVFADDAIHRVQSFLPHIIMRSHHRALRHTMGEVQHDDEVLFTQAENAYANGELVIAMQMLRDAEDGKRADRLLKAWVQDAMAQDAWNVAAMIAHDIEHPKYRISVYALLAMHYRKEGSTSRLQHAQQQIADAGLYPHPIHRQSQRWQEAHAALVKTGASEWAEMLSAHMKQYGAPVDNGQEVEEVVHPRSVSLRSNAQETAHALDTLCVLHMCDAHEEKTPLSQAQITSSGGQGIAVNALSADDFAMPKHLYTELDMKSEAYASGVETLPAYAPATLSFVSVNGSRWVPQAIQDSFHNAQALLIRHGSLTVEQLYHMLRAYDASDRMIKDDDGYLLRIPVIIGPDAGLIIEGGATLKLSTEARAFIINAGELLIHESQVRGWSEGMNTPHVPDDSNLFRPFLFGWSHASLSISDSHIAALGYDQKLQHGITIQPYHEARNDSARQRIVNSTLTQLYRPLTLKDNTHSAIMGNVISAYQEEGIRVSGAAKGSVIAYNEMRGGQAKHALHIQGNSPISVIGNVMTDHRASGIYMKDASSTFLYANQVTHNRDGISLKDSHCILLSHHDISQNQRSGIYAIASHSIGALANRLDDNGSFGMYVGNPADASIAYTDITLSTNRFSRNGVGLKTQQLHAIAAYANVWTDQAPKLVRGDWWDAQPLLRSKVTQGAPVYLYDTEMQTEHRPCRFAYDGLIYQGEARHE